MSTVTNGQVRKSLASQLDRLDSILDALSDGLNEAVAMVVQESVTAAVHAATIEVLTNPALQQRLRQSIKADKPANPIARGVKHLWGWIRGGVGYVCSKVGSLFRSMSAKTVSAIRSCKGAIESKVVNIARKTKAVVKGAWAGTLLAVNCFKHSRTLFLPALAAGITLAIGSYWCGPIVSSLLNGIAGFFAYLGASVMKVMRGVVGAERLQET
jgi:hypothetical protein